MNTCFMIKLLVIIVMSFSLYYHATSPQKLKATDRAKILKAYVKQRSTNSSQLKTSGRLSS
jgi:starvation-inducible outer membrane lipoprotein